MFAVQAVCTMPTSSLFGHTVNLWTFKSKARADKALPRLEIKHGSSYRAFAVVDLDAPPCGECSGTPLDNRVPVLDRNGGWLGSVAANATSIGAAKVAGTASAEYSRRFGGWAWIAKD